MPTAHLIYNPRAGRFTAPAMVDRAANLLVRHGWAVQVHPSESGEHATELAERAAAEDADVLLVAGGDGSLEHAIRGILGSRTALGMLPAGTANVWAQEIGLPPLNWTDLTALERSARRLVNGRIQSVDVGLCNGTPFLLWAGVGLDAFIVHSVEPRRRWEKIFGSLQYAISALISAPRWRGVDLQVEADGQSTSGHYLLVVMSNIRLYAGGLATLSPGARLDDGRMELWLFTGRSFWEALRHVWAIWAGRHHKSSRVERIPFQTAWLRSDAPLYLQVDGEPLNVGPDVQITIEHRALNVLVPDGAPESLFEREPINRLTDGRKPAEE